MFNAVLGSYRSEWWLSSWFTLIATDQVLPIALRPQEFVTCKAGKLRVFQLKWKSFSTVRLISWLGAYNPLRETVSRYKAHVWDLPPS